MPYKGTVITEMFLHTADENYIVARWCHDNQLTTDFFWNSAHALEKYMKAVLLFNGQSVKSFNHGLAELFDAVKNLVGSLLPTILTQPKNLNTSLWKDMTPRAFVKTLDQNGNAENRYLTYGYVQHSWYLYMVDSMVWALRRLAISLDCPIFRDEDEHATPTYRSVLSKQPEYAPNHMLQVDKLIRGKDSKIRRALLNNNSAFAPSDYQHEARSEGFSSRNPVLVLSIIDPLKSDSVGHAKQGYQTGKWLLENTKQSKPVRKQIESEMQSAINKHPEIDKP